MKPREMAETSFTPNGPESQPNHLKRLNQYAEHKGDRADYGTSFIYSVLHWLLP
jgi:hypothetical protein